MQVGSKQTEKNGVHWKGRWILQEDDIIFYIKVDQKIHEKWDEKLACKWLPG